ncbi:MAG TPA: MarR family transcriptional regulator [Gammaproteobacteria bacterium]
MARKGAKQETTSAQPAGQARPPSLDLENLIGYNLRRAHGVQRQRFASVFGPHAIRPVQLSILWMIYDQPGLKQSELGRALEIKRANIVTLLAELERRKLIVRRTAHSDRRAHVLDLTPAGKKLTARLLALHERLENDLAECLGQRERAELLRLLKKVRRLETAPEISCDD